MKPKTQLDILAEALRHWHPIYEEKRVDNHILNSTVYCVSYYAGKFYSYNNTLNVNYFYYYEMLKALNAVHNIHNVHRKCKTCGYTYLDNGENNCLSCIDKYVSDHISAIRYNLSYKIIATSSFKLGFSYIEERPASIRLHTTLINIGGSIKNNAFINALKMCDMNTSAIPFMAIQLASQMILIGEFDLVSDIRRLIMAAFIDTSFPTQN